MLSHVALLFLGTAMIVLNVVVSMSGIDEVTTAGTVMNDFVALVAVVVCAFSVKVCRARRPKEENTRL